MCCYFVFLQHRSWGLKEVYGFFVLFWVYSVNVSIKIQYEFNERRYIFDTIKKLDNDKFLITWR